MRYSIEFELKEEHIKLIKALNFGFNYSNPYGDLVTPRFNAKRLLGNETSSDDVARVIGMTPKNGDKLTDDEILICQKLVVELPLALEVMVKQQTFTPGFYVIENSISYLDYIMARNYLYIKPYVDKIDKSIIEYTTIAQNILVETDDQSLVLKAFYNKIVELKKAGWPLPFIDLLLEDLQTAITAAEKKQKLKEFYIPVEWSVWDKVTIKAYSLEEAVRILKEHIEDIPLGTEPEYIDGSYHIDDGQGGDANIEDTVQFIKFAYPNYSDIDPDYIIKSEQAEDGQCEDANIE